MGSIQNLLVLYTGIILLNALLALMLWRAHRTPLHRSVFLLWASTMVGFVAQGLLVMNDLALIGGFSCLFLVTLSLADLLNNIIGTTTPWRMFCLMMLGCVVLSTALSLLGYSFAVSALPVAIGICVPVVMALVLDFRRKYREISFTGKGLAISSLVYIAHTMDYPFLRKVDSFASYGFTIGILILFALSIFAPAVVLEIVTEREARNSAEMDVARRIQTRILPREPAVPGFEIECYMQPADEVGGDYYDVFSVGKYTWVLLGDVTGHGLSSGLVMLMAQSVIRSIVQTKTMITPGELNTLANKVLFENLRRLDESRTMTIASFAREQGKDEFRFHGTHDNIFVWRSDNNEVEVMEVGHFPCGLGLLEEIDKLVQPETTLKLSKGDLLFLGTDGVTEAASAGDYANGLFDEKRVIQFLQKHGDKPLKEIRSLLIAELAAFTLGVFHDDVTFLMIRKND